MVIVASDIPCPAAFYIARGMAEAIPDRLPTAVEIPCTFDLIGGGCGAPQEVFGKGSLSSRGALFRRQIERRRYGGAGKFWQSSGSNPSGGAGEKVSTVHDRKSPSGLFCQKKYDG